MGSQFSKDYYERLKKNPELVAGVPFDVVNNELFGFMLNDITNFSNLHKQIQIFGSMTTDKIIITSLQGSISLMPLLQSLADDTQRMEILRKLSELGAISPEYYSAYPTLVFVIILEFIRIFRDSYGFREKLYARFCFDHFTHNGILNICRNIKFTGASINRPEDIFLEHVSKGIKSMYRFMTKEKNMPPGLAFKCLEGYYHKSMRQVLAVDGTRVPYEVWDYPVVPIIPTDDIPQIMSCLDEDKRTPEYVSYLLRLA